MVKKELTNITRNRLNNYFPEAKGDTNEQIRMLFDIKMLKPKKDAHRNDIYKRRSGDMCIQT